MATETASHLDLKFLKPFLRLCREIAIEVYHRKQMDSVEHESYIINAAEVKEEALKH
jgi:hypothetical protein